MNPKLKFYKTQKRESLHDQCVATNDDATTQEAIIHYNMYAESTFGPFEYQLRNLLLKKFC